MLYVAVDLVRLNSDELNKLFLLTFPNNLDIKIEHHIDLDKIWCRKES